MMSPFCRWAGCLLAAVLMWCSAGCVSPRGRAGPPVGVFGCWDRAHHVVYVSDRSGSMVCTFDEVRAELMRSISRLKGEQDFTVLMLASTAPREGPGKGLVPATDQNKARAVKFLGRVTGGQTTLLPALRRAFELLAAADPDRPGKCVFVLSDGDFGGITAGSVYRAKDGRKLTGNEAVIQFLRDHNAAGGIRVHMILLWSQDPTAREVYQTIASENGGRFISVALD
jgi:hypothetical protein